VGTCHVGLPNLSHGGPWNLHKFEAMHSPVLVIVILSVCPSVCHTRGLCPHDSTYDHAFSPYDSPIILLLEISGSSRNSKVVTPSDGVQWGWGWYELAIFDLYAVASPKRCQIRVIRQRLLFITNRKLNTRFRLVPKSTALVDSEMTLDGNYAVCCITHMSFGANHLNLNEDRPILSAAKMYPRDWIGLSRV